MKLAAHPLVVAVAMGLLDSSALAGLDDTSDAPKTHCACDEQLAEGPVADAPVVAEDDDLDALIQEFRVVLGS